MMKFLITGANGFLGSHLCTYLRENNANYVGCARLKSRDDIFKTGDLTTFNEWTSLFLGIDIVIHTAAKAHDMSNSETLEFEYKKNNLDLTIKLANEAKKNGVRKFIFISTIKVNGESTELNPYTAKDIPNPTDSYGLSKYHTELEILKLHNKDEFEVVIIRPCLIYGSGVKANFKNLIKLVELCPVLPLASVTNKRSYISIDNLISLIIEVSHNKNSGGKVFLCSDDFDMSLTDTIRLLAKVKNKNVILLPIPTFLLKNILKAFGKSDVAERLFNNLQVDIQYTKTTLNWHPPYTVEDQFKKYFTHPSSSIARVSHQKAL